MKYVSTYDNLILHCFRWMQVSGFDRLSYTRVNTYSYINNRNVYCSLSASQWHDCLVTPVRHQDTVFFYFFKHLSLLIYVLTILFACFNQIGSIYVYSTVKRWQLSKENAKLYLYDKDCNVSQSVWSKLETWDLRVNFLNNYEVSYKFHFSTTYL